MAEAGDGFVTPAIERMHKDSAGRKYGSLQTAFKAYLEERPVSPPPEHQEVTVFRDEISVVQDSKWEGDPASPNESPKEADVKSKDSGSVTSPAKPSTGQAAAATLAEAGHTLEVAERRPVSPSPEHQEVTVFRDEISIVQENELEGDPSSPIVSPYEADVKSEESSPLTSTAKPSTGQAAAATVAEAGHTLEERKPVSSPPEHQEVTVFRDEIPVVPEMELEGDPSCLNQSPIEADVKLEESGLVTSAVKPSTGQAAAATVAEAGNTLEVAERRPVSPSPEHQEVTVFRDEISIVQENELEGDPSSPIVSPYEADVKSEESSPLTSTAKPSTGQAAAATVAEAGHTLEERKPVSSPPEHQEVTVFRDEISIVQDKESEGDPSSRNGSPKEADVKSEQSGPVTSPAKPSPGQAAAATLAEAGHTLGGSEADLAVLPLGPVSETKQSKLVTQANEFENTQRKASQNCEKETNDHLQNPPQKFETTIAESTTIAELDKKVKFTEGRVSHFRGKLQALELNYEDLFQDFRGLSRACEQLERGNQDLDRAYKEKETESARHLTKAESYARSYHQMKMIKESVIKDNAEKDKLVRDLGAQLEQIKKENSNLKKENNNLQNQMSLYEQQHANEQSRGGSYLDDTKAATPALLVSALNGVKDASNNFVKVLRSSLQPGVAVQLGDHIGTVSRNGHIKFQYQAFVCRVLFEDFDLPYAGSSKVVLPPTSYFRQYQMHDLKKTDTVERLLQNDPEINPSLQGFCFDKFSKLLEHIDPFLIDRSIELKQQIQSKQHPRGSKLYVSFCKVAVSVWLLHRLAFSFLHPAKPFAAKIGERFDLNRMQSVVPLDDPASDEELQLKVGFYVLPGFDIGNSAIPCEVYVTLK